MLLTKALIKNNIVFSCFTARVFYEHQITTFTTVLILNEEVYKLLFSFFFFVGWTHHFSKTWNTMKKEKHNLHHTIVKNHEAQK
jgi:hypothetical protein